MCLLSDAGNGFLRHTKSEREKKRERWRGIKKKKTKTKKTQKKKANNTIQLRRCSFLIFDTIARFSSDAKFRTFKRSKLKPSVMTPQK